MNYKFHLEVTIVEDKEGRGQFVRTKKGIHERLMQGNSPTWLAPEGESHHASYVI